jgi:hypothetical protein
MASPMTLMIRPRVALPTGTYRAYASQEISLEDATFNRDIAQIIPP